MMHKERKFEFRGSLLTSLFYRPLIIFFRVAAYLFEFRSTFSRINS